MPAHSLTPSVVLDRVSFAWPDGSSALDDVSGAFGAGRTGLVGRNGSGKSTLLRLIAGELSPAAGHITTSTDAAYLPQRLTLDVDRPVAALLGVAETLGALRAIESGDVDPRHFDAVGSDWDIESRAHGALADAGLVAWHARSPRRRAVRRRGGARRDRRDPAARRRRSRCSTSPRTTSTATRGRASYAMVRAWRGTLIVVSHDTALLELMDDTAELYENELTVFGGPYSQWRAWLDAEQDAARQAERTAEQASSARSGTASRPRRRSRCARRWEQGAAREAGAADRRGQPQARGRGVGGKAAHRGARQGVGRPHGAGCRRAAGARRRPGAHRPARSERAGRAPHRDAGRRRPLLDHPGPRAGGPGRAQWVGQDHPARAVAWRGAPRQVWRPPRPGCRSRCERYGGAAHRPRRVPAAAGRRAG